MYRMCASVLIGMSVVAGGGGGGVEKRVVMERNGNQYPTQLKHTV
jgi:hypothetical protein